MAHGLETIDWSAPWLVPYKTLADNSATLVSDGAPVYGLLNQLAELQLVKNSLTELPIRFVAQSELPNQEPYERFIFNSKTCPTRDGLHDFFNGLCWIHFPKTKARLNQLQAEQIQTLGSVTTRGPVRDALTVFDENAAFLFAPTEIWEALIAKDWQKLFVDLRPLWDNAYLVLFGHALLEKLVTPRKPITAHVYVCQHPKGELRPNLEVLDTFIADDLTAEKLATKPFTPLPVLGVPTWWHANEDVRFYDDETVFRKPKFSGS